MECERLYGGKVRYDGLNCWCRECQMALMIGDLITMNGFGTLRCPCCHQRVRFNGKYDPKKGRVKRLKAKKSLT